MAISRMQEPRQLYGLGSLVKSIGKTIKKVVKSPIGKAAILGLGAYGLGGGLGGKFSLGTLGSRLGLGTLTGGEENVFAGGPFSGIANFARDKFSNMGTGTKLGIGTALATYLAQGGMEEEEIAEIQNDPDKLKMYLKDYYSKTNPDASGTEIEEFVRINSATGGRIGFNEGTNMKMASMDENEKEFERLVDDFMERGFSLQEAIEEAKDTLERKSIAVGGRVGLKSGTRKYKINDFAIDEQAERLGIKRYYLKDMSEDGETYDADEVREMVFGDQYAVGGRVGLMGGAMPTGIMRANKAGTIERDYRETGGFVPVGIKEKADDVPAMLSKNEFVMTADAVRGIGDGNIEKGAQRLYDQMKTAEKRVV